MKSVNIEAIVIVVDNSLLHPEKSINLFMDLIKFSFYFIIQNSLFIVIINLLFPKLFLFLLIIQTPENSESFIAFTFVFWKLYLFTYNKIFARLELLRRFLLQIKRTVKAVNIILNNTYFKYRSFVRFILYLKAKIKLRLQAKLIPYTSWIYILDFLNFFWIF